jgi:hypothetical protein
MSKLGDKYRIIKKKVVSPIATILEYIIYFILVLPLQIMANKLCAQAIQSV